MLTKRHITLVSQSSLFLGVPIDTLEVLFSRSPAQVRKYNKGALIAFRGDVYDSLKIVLSGSVVAEFDNLQGKTLKVETIEAPGVLATSILFSEQNFLPVNVRAAAETEILSVPGSTILELMQSNRTILVNFLQDAGDKLVILAEKLRLLQFTTIRQRIAAYLLGLKEREDSDVLVIPYTREVLAELFGVARPSLSRAFSNLQNEGTLGVDGKEVVILNEGKLRDELENLE